MAAAALALYLEAVTSLAPELRLAGDGALARAVAAGSAAAERALCERFAPRARLYGLRHLRDEAAAADLAQDVLVLVLDALRAGRVQEPDRLASFVLGACRTVAGQRRRLERRRAALLDLHAAALPESDGAEPVLDRARLERCLEALPARDRAVVALAFGAGCSAAEVAAELGVSAENARAIRHRAVVRLRGCMGVAEEPS